jgi:peptide/nickel transport system permease protein
MSGDVVSAITPVEPAFPTDLSLARRMRSSVPFVAGSALVLALVLVAALGPAVLPDPTALDPGALLAGPSAKHWLGTDQLGRDMLSRLVSAAGTDLRIAALALIAPFVVGVLLGTLAGYFGGWTDTVISRVVDVLVAFPFYVLVIALVFAVGTGEHGIYVAMAVVGWVSYARVIRAGTQGTVRQDWVTAARQAGVPTWRVIARHVLPHTLTQAVVLLASDVVVVIVAVITLGYLGLGIQPPTPDWGSMIADNRAFITSQWWLPAMPGFAVVVTGLGFALLADGIADVWRVRR